LLPFVCDMNPLYSF